MKQEMLSEVKQADAIGVDLGKSSEYNNAIIKEILAIYFSILKGQAKAGTGSGSNGERMGSSPLLKSVFLGIP